MNKREHRQPSCNDSFRVVDQRAEDFLNITHKQAGCLRRQALDYSSWNRVHHERQITGYKLQSNCSWRFWDTRRTDNL